MLKLKEKINKISMKIYFGLKKAEEKVEDFVADVTENTAGEAYVDTLVKILIAVVVGALLLAGLYALVGKNVMPAVEKKVTELFNYKG